MTLTLFCQSEAKKIEGYNRVSNKKKKRQNDGRPGRRKWRQCLRQKDKTMPHRWIVDGGAWRLRVVHVPHQLPTLPVAPEDFQSAFGVEISSYLCICFGDMFSWTYLEKELSSRSWGFHLQSPPWGNQNTLEQRNRDCDKNMMMRITMVMVMMVMVMMMIHQPEDALDLGVKKAVGQADYKALGGQKGRSAGLHKEDIMKRWYFWERLTFGMGNKSFEKEILLESCAQKYSLKRKYHWFVPYYFWVMVNDLEMTLSQCRHGICPKFYTARFSG